jgi:hypothetical protein
VHHDVKLHDLRRALSKGKKPEGDPGGKGVAPFSEEEVVMSIYDGPVPHESRRKLKLMSQELNIVSPATPGVPLMVQVPYHF